MHRSKAPVTSSPPSLTLSPRPLCAVCSFLSPPRPTPNSSYFNKEAIQIIAKIAVAAGNLTPAPPPDLKRDAEYGQGSCGAVGKRPLCNCVVADSIPSCDGAPSSQPCAALM
jgi:hypothetical protein